MIDERDFLERAHLDRTTLEVWVRESWICPGPDRAGARPTPTWTSPAPT